MSSCPVKTAWDYGNHDMHEGAGFWLVLTMKNGDVLRGPCHTPRDGKILMENWKSSFEPMWVQCDQVQCAEVEW